MAIVMDCIVVAVAALLIIYVELVIRASLGGW